MTPGDAAVETEIRLLGPLEVVVDGAPREVAGDKLRVLLGVLALHPGRRVSDGDLAEALWPSGLPPSGSEGLRVHVSRLRRLLGESALVRDRGGYVLVPHRLSTDAQTFEHLVQEARGLRDGDLERAVERYRRAEALWRGGVLADVPFDRLPGEALGLEELRLVALEERLEAELAAGRGPAIGPELEVLVAEHGSRERLRALQMLALYAGGRQSEALAAYQDARRVLADELGIEPGPELRELERRVLLQDPDLPGAAAARTRRRQRRARVAASFAGAALVTALALAAVAVVSKSARAPVIADITPDSLVALDPRTGAVRALLKLPEGPDQIAVTEDALWVSSVVARTVSRIDRKSHALDVAGGVSAAGDLAASSGGEVWLGNLRAREVTLVNPANADFREPRPTVGVPGGAVALDAAAETLYVTLASADDRPGSLARVDLRRRRVLGTTPVGVFPASVDVAGGVAWVANYGDGTVGAVTRDGRVRRVVRVGDGPITVVATPSGVWVGLFWENEVVRIDPGRGEVVARIPVGKGLWGMAAGSGSVWVANRDSRSLSRIDPATNRVVQSIALPAAPYSVAVADGRLWFTTQECGSPNVDCERG